MKKFGSSVNKYWEIEKGELIEMGHSFMRCFDKAGKLQFGSIINDSLGEKKYIVKFVLDRQELIDSSEGAAYLLETIDEWRDGDYGN